MRVYLFGHPLIQSQFYENMVQERKKRDKENSSSQSERDWSIGLWNCKDKLTAEEDNISSKMDYEKNLTADAERFLPGIIEVKLIDTNQEAHYGSAFKEYLPVPEKILFISSYNSFIETSKKNVMSLVRQLEKAEIDCLVDHKGGTPLPYDYDYLSPRMRRLQKQIAKVKMIII